MTTNADAHSTIVTAAATSGRQPGPAAVGLGRVAEAGSASEVTATMLARQ
ncbi:hypothetical protein GCM10022236_03070 [Microlunatus ginsengisoli]|uniref:Uncharacterized protein n=1 Tax=Microlunatus ginsengisoli TaxID=363863 RepID=A0ABP6ZCW9_9ACTN